MDDEAAAAMIKVGAVVIIICQRKRKRKRDEPHKESPGREVGSGKKSVQSTVEKDIAFVFEEGEERHTRTRTRTFTDSRSRTIFTRGWYSLGCDREETNLMQLLDREDAKQQQRACVWSMMDHRETSVPVLTCVKKHFLNEPVETKRSSWKRTPPPTPQADRSGRAGE